VCRRWLLAAPLDGRGPPRVRQAVTNDGTAREHLSRRASPGCRPKPATGASSTPERGRSLSLGVEATPLGTHCRSDERPRGSPRGVDRRMGPPRRDQSHAVTRGVPPTAATEVAGRCKTRSGNPATSPMGFGSFRRFDLGDRCAGLPHRHHPLSEFLTLSAV